MKKVWSWLRAFIIPFIYALLFVAIQGAVSVFAVLGASFFSKGIKPDDPVLLLWISGITSIITILVFFFTKWCPMSRDYIRSRPWLFLFWTVVFALGIIIPFTKMEEFIPASWTIDATHGVLGNMLKSPEGYFVICMLAPLTEEVVCRGAVITAVRRWLGGLVSERSSAWIAICFSAFLFALVHFNPAQIPHALLMGVILGWLYVKTGSIVPGFLVHWINNSTAYVFVTLFPNIPVDAHLSAYFGSDANVWKAVGYSLLIALPALYQLIKLKVKK